MMLHANTPGKIHCLQGRRKALEIGGGTDDGACISVHMLGRSGGMLRSLLRPYFVSPNATSPTRVHGGSNTAIHHDTCQSS